MTQIRESLTNTNYDKAMVYIGGYFNSDYVFSERFDENSGFVLFESTTVTNNPNKTDTTKFMLQESYSGFIYNVSGKYSVSRTSNNQTKLLATDLDDKEVTFTVLDRDKDSDGNYDSNNTLEDYGFMFVDLPKSKIKSIKTLKFIDCEGNPYKTFDLSSKLLKYESSFFTDVNEFVTAFNADNYATNLKELDVAFRAKNSKYTYSNYGSGNSNVTVKAILIILAYFAVVYLIADSGLGKRYVYRGIKYLVIKIFKIQPKPKEEKNNSFSDYYSQLTIKLDISALSDEEKEKLPNEVEIKYNSETEILNFKLSKDEDYKKIERLVFTLT